MNHKSPMPVATPKPQLLCHIVGVQTLTVGQKSSLTCDAASLGDLAQKKLEFAQGDLKTPYAIQFLGSPVFTNGSLNQIFTSYKTGRHTLSSVQLKINDQSVLISPLDFEVKSVIEKTAGSKPTPFPEIEPQSVAVPLWWWVMWSVGAVLIMSFITWKLIERRRRNHLRGKEEVAVNLTPQEKFQLALRQLESKGLHIHGEYKSFAVELTYIIKKTLGSELHFPAEDLTSEELLSTLERRHGAFFNTAGTSLASFLADLDRIKFAKVETNQEQCSTLLDKASRIGNAVFGRLA